MKKGDILTFRREGQPIEGRVLSADADESCAVWVVDLKDPDKDYLVQPQEIERVKDKPQLQEASQS